MSGVPPSQICLLWLQQCFLNYLDFPEIVLYISCVFVMGVDYQVYFLVSLFKHLRWEIMLQSQESNLLLFLRTSPIRSYGFREYLDYFEELHAKYGAMLLEDFDDIQ